MYLPAGADLDLHCDQKETVGSWETRSCCRDRKVCDVKAVLFTMGTYSVRICCKITLLPFQRL